MTCTITYYCKGGRNTKRTSILNGIKKKTNQNFLYITIIKGLQDTYRQFVDRYEKRGFTGSHTLLTSDREGDDGI